MNVWRLSRRFAGAAKRELFPQPVVAATRCLEARADREPRYTPGRISVFGLDLDYVDSRTLAVQWQEIFVREALAIDLASPSPRILDCGANIGLASIWLKRRYPRARITAFEPDGAIAETLQRNLTRNAAADVEVVRAAVWNEDGRLAFRREGADSGALNAVAADTTGELIDVPTVRLRRWLDAEAVDLLKMDIEGAELDVLADIADRLQQVRNLYVEVHDFDPQRRILPECLQAIERAGFIYALGDFASATWRPAGHRQGPFGQAVPAWIVLVRAWRRS